MLSVINITGSHIELATHFFKDLQTRPQVELLLGAINKNKQLVGIAFLSPMNAAKNGIYSFDIKALTHDIEHQINHILLSEIEKVASIHLISKLIKLTPSIQPDEISFYTDHGLSIMRWCSLFQLDIAAIHSLVAPTTDIDDYKIRYDLKLLPYNHNQEEINELCLGCFEVLTHGHLAATGQLLDNKDYKYSYSLWQGNKLVAGLATGIIENIATIDPLIIEPNYRNSWPFNIIIKHTAQKLLEANISTGQVTILEDNKKMMKFIKKSNPITLERSAAFAKQYDV